MSHLRAHLLIHGKVQGVGYRAWTATTARAGGLVGWVKNLCDGRVEAVVEGDAHSVRTFVRGCEIGPHSAVVENVAVAWHDATGEFSGFSVRTGD